MLIQHPQEGITKYST